MATMYVVRRLPEYSQSLPMGRRRQERLQDLQRCGEPTTFTYPDGEIVASTYDSKGYFFGMSTSNGAIISAVQYTNSGQAAGMTIGGIAYQGSVTIPITVSLGYDSLQRVTPEKVAVRSNTLFSQTQTYDNVGNVLQLSTTVPTTSGSSLTNNQSSVSETVGVTPAQRSQAASDNSQAASRVDPAGAYGPQSCVYGYVWREAFGGDDVCVTPGERSQVASDNSQAIARIVAL